MTGKVADVTDFLDTPDHIATQLTDMWLTWDMLRQNKKTDWTEIVNYIYATDTRSTSNNKLPWKNKTTIPKLCQIMDNLHANYTDTMFSNSNSMEWQADTEDSNDMAKRDAIINYMTWATDQPSFKHEIDKVLLDYIQYGNCFVTVEWSDERTMQSTEGDGKVQAGYVGPTVRRISPLDIVMNPTAENFISSPKVIRSMVSLGEIKKFLERESNSDDTDTYQELWKYLKDIRRKASEFDGDLITRDNRYSIDGFTSFREYLQSNYVEVLTFYGDMYDSSNDEFLENYVITCVDRHKLIMKKPNPSYFGYPPIFHAAWRKKQDNLWGMGPLDNLVGMQYRLDHVENMKADIYDLVTFPVQKIKGFVEDFTWQPGEKIFVSEEGDVELLSPDVNALQANFEIKNLEQTMEEMAGAPREAMGFRTPGEKTKYEVQSMENASARIYNNRTKQFEENVLERVYNAMLEMTRRNMTGVQTIRVFDDEFKMASFQSLTVNDITGTGRIKPIGSRHFAEEALLVQNLNSLAMSNMWPSVQPHFSSIKLAKLYEQVFNLERYKVVTPFVALAEQADGQRQAQALQEGTAMAGMTATGLGNDTDMPMNPQALQAPQGQQ